MLDFPLRLQIRLRKKNLNFKKNFECSFQKITKHHNWSSNILFLHFKWWYDRRVLKSRLFTQECHRFVHNTHKYINREVFFETCTCKNSKSTTTTTQKEHILCRHNSRNEFKFQRGCPLLLCNVSQGIPGFLYYFDTMKI